MLTAGGTHGKKIKGWNRSLSGTPFRRFLEVSLCNEWLQPIYDENKQRRF